MTFVLTGLDIEAKADLTLAALNAKLGGPERFAEFETISVLHFFVIESVFSAPFVTDKNPS